MHQKLIKLALSLILVLGLMPSMAFATPAKNTQSKESAQEGLLSSSSSEEPTLKESGTWGTCAWDLDTSTETITIHPGTAGSSEASPWYYDPDIKRHKKIKHVILSEENGEKVIFPEDSSGLFYPNALWDLESIDFSGADTSNVTNAYNLCRGLWKLKAANMSSLDFQNVTNTSYMFYNCMDLESVALPSNMQKVTNAEFMFANCNSMATLTKEGVLSSLEKCTKMFSDCYALDSQTAQNFLNLITSPNLKEMHGMFQICTSLTTLDISGLNLKEVTTMRELVRLCSNLVSINIGEHRDLKVTDISYLVESCTALKAIDLSKFDTSNVNDMNFIFYGCTALEEIDLSGNDVTDQREILTTRMYDGCNSLHTVHFGENVKQTAQLPEVVINNHADWYSVADNEWYTSSWINTNRKGISDTYTKYPRKSIQPLVIQDFVDKVYTGQSITQDVVITDEDYTLVENTDYTVSYQNNIMPGTAKVIITGKGNYGGTIEKTFTITAKSIEGATVTGIENKTYTGSAITQSPVVKDGDNTLVENTDYTVSYQSNTFPGTAKVIIAGKDGYSGTIEKTFTISAKSIDSATVTGIENKTYTGADITQTPVVKDGDYTLVENTDYTVTYQNNKMPGTAKVIITGKDGYTGTIEKEFTITPESINNATITGLVDAKYTGQPITQNPEVKIQNVVLVKDVDYELSYADNINPGQASVTITGKGGFTDFVTHYFVIGERPISEATVTGIVNKRYTGSPITQSPVLTIGDITLRENIDYTVDYDNNTNPGTATVVLTGLSGFTGEARVDFTIFEKSIEGVTVTGIENKTYTGSAITQTPHITDGNYALIENTDYELTYESNIEPGEAVVIITGKGTYGGTLRKTFTINPKSIAEVEIAQIAEHMTYTGSAITQPLILTDGNYALVENTDFKATFANNIEPGEATITIEGQGKYTGTKNLSFTIDPKAIDGVTVTGIENKEYVGTPITQTPHITDGNYALQENVDYTLSYEANINPGQATVTITGKGRYTGSITRNFDISAKDITGLTVSGIVDKEYTGDPITQTIEIKNGGYVLQENVDYTVHYEYNIFPGTAIMTIAGMGGYMGQTTKTFIIGKKQLNTVTLVLSQTVFAYDGEVHVPTIVSVSDARLVEGEDYVVKYSNVNSKDAGTYEVWIEGIERCEGISVKARYTIAPAKPDIVVQPTKKETVKPGTTTPVTISVKVKPSAGGTLSYQWYSNGKAIKGANKASYTIKNPSSLKPGKYKLYCMITETIGTVKASVKSQVSTLDIKRALSFVQMTPKGKNSLVMSWNKEAAADGYDVFFSRCNHGTTIEKCKKIKTLKGAGNTSFTKSKLLANTCYKAYVRPFKMVSGKKVYLATSPQAHAYTNGGSQKYSNPKKIALSKSTASIKAKQSFQLKAKVTIADLKKKIISEGHASVVRYFSSDTTVAKVGKTGKVVGVAKGTATIYAITQNGIVASCKVAVK